MNRSKLPKSMSKLAKTERQKSQLGSDAIGVRAEFAENTKKPQQQGPPADLVRQPRGRSWKNSNRGTRHATSARPKHPRDAEGPFQTPKQNPTALNQSRQRSLITTGP